MDKFEVLFEMSLIDDGSNLKIQDTEEGYTILLEEREVVRLIKKLQDIVEMMKVPRCLACGRLRFTTDKTLSG